MMMIKINKDMKHIEKKEVFDKEEVKVYYPNRSNKDTIVKQLYRSSSKTSIDNLVTDGKIDDDVIRICKKHKLNLFIDMLNYLIKNDVNLRALHSLQEMELIGEKLIIYDVKGNKILVPTRLVTIHSGDYIRKYFLTDVDKNPYPDTTSQGEMSNYIVDALQDGNFSNFISGMTEATNYTKFGFISIYYYALREVKLKKINIKVVEFITTMKDKKFMKYGKGEFDWFED